MASENHQPSRAAESNACLSSCVWCGAALKIRKVGGKPRRFCSRKHHKEYYRSLWRAATKLARAGLFVFENGEWRLRCSKQCEQFKTYESPELKGALTDRNLSDDSSVNINLNDPAAQR